MKNQKQSMTQIHQLNGSGAVSLWCFGHLALNADPGLNISLRQFGRQPNSSIHQHAIYNQAVPEPALALARMRAHTAHEILLWCSFWPVCDWCA